MVWWHVFRVCDVGYCIAFAYVQCNAHMVMVYFNCMVVIEYFYLFAYIGKRHAVIQAIL